MDTNKAVAGGGGAGVGIGMGGAVASLIIALFWKNADASVAANLTTVLNGVFGIVGAYAGAYLVPHNPGP